MTETIFTIVGSLGFPIVVAWFLLTRMQKTMDANTRAIEKLEETLSEVCKAVYTSKDKNLPV